MLTTAAVTLVDKTIRRGSPNPFLVFTVGCFFEEDILRLVFTFFGLRSRFEDLIASGIETEVILIDNLILTILT